MLFLELVMVVVLYIEGVFYSYFINIYTFVGVLLLISLCVRNSNIC